MQMSANELLALKNYLKNRVAYAKYYSGGVWHKIGIHEVNFDSVENLLISLVNLEISAATRCSLHFCTSLLPVDLFIPWLTVRTIPRYVILIIYIWMEKIIGF